MSAAISRPRMLRAGIAAIDRTTLVGSIVPRAIDEYDIGVFLYALEDDFPAVWRNVEIPNVEVGGQVSQLALCSGVEIDEPQVLVFYLSAHRDKCASAVKEPQTSGSARQREIRNCMGPGGGGHRLHLECGSDVRARVHEEISVWRPHRIESVFLDQRNVRAVQ